MLLREIRDFPWLYHVISAFCTSTSLLISSENHMKITTETPMQCATQRHAFFQPPGAWRQPNRNVRRRGVRRRGAKDPRSTRHRGRKDTPRRRPKSPWKARPIRWCGCSNMFHLDGLNMAESFQGMEKNVGKINISQLHEWFTQKRFQFVIWFYFTVFEMQTPRSTCVCPIWTSNWHGHFLLVICSYLPLSIGNCELTSPRQDWKRLTH